MKDTVTKVEEKISEASEKTCDTVFEELRERDARRLNLILHGVPECDQEQATGRVKQQWDKEQCVKISKVMDLNYDEEAFKFCRRVGPVAQGPRPLVIGLYTDMERSMLMRRATRLVGSEYSEVRLAPDLTKRQRKEERTLWEEMETRNATRTADQVQKNLVWAVVGSRGEKRLLLQPERQGTTQERGRGRGRGRQPVRGVGRPPTNPGVTRSRGRPTRPTAQQGEMEADTTPAQGGVTETEMETAQGPVQPAGAQKRRAEGGPQGQPPEKR